MASQKEPTQIKVFVNILIETLSAKRPTRKHDASITTDHIQYKRKGCIEPITFKPRRIIKKLSNPYSIITIEKKIIKPMFFMKFVGDFKVQN